MRASDSPSRQAALTELGRRAMQGAPLSELLDEAAAAVADALDADCCTVHERLGEGEFPLRAASGRCDDAAEPETTDPQGESPLGRALSQDGPVIAGDLAVEPRFDAAAAPLDDATSGVSVVVESGDEPWGVLGAYTADRRAFTEADAAFARNVATLLGTSIRRRRVEIDVEKVLGRVTDAFYALDADWNFEYLNERAEELIAPEGEQLVGRNVWEAFPEASESTIGEEYRRAMAEQTPVSFEEYYEPLDTWFDIRAYPSETGLSVYFRDVDERKRMERELRESEAKFRTLTEHLQEIVWMTTPDTEELLYVNPTYEEVWGRDRETLYDDPHAFVEAIHPDDRERVEEAYGALPDSEYDEEFRVVRPDGTVRWVRARAVPVTDESGDAVRVVGIAEDVTERRERERALRERERRLERYREYTDDVLDAIDDVFYVLDDEGRLQRWNRSLADVTGYSDDELESMSAFEFFPEDEAERIASATERAFRSGTARVEGEILTKEGERIPYEFQATPLEDPAGDPVLAGIGREISERRKRERELEQQREQLAALDQLNGVVREVTEAVIEQSTREEIERTVCEALAESESYEFAWIAEVDTVTDEIRARVEAGVEDYVENLSLSFDPDEPTGQGPAGRAVRRREMQVVHDVFEDPSFELWRDQAERHGYRALAVIPIVYEETLYGLLGAYADRTDAFEDEEREVIGQLGEIVGHAIAAVERKRALMSDEVVEVEFRLRDVFEALDVSASTDDRIAFDRAVPVGDGTYLEYGTTTEEGLAVLETLTEQVPHWESVSAINEEFGEVTFELRLSEPPVISTVASHGGSLERATIEGGDFQLTTRLPQGVDVRTVIERVREVYPGAEAVARRQIPRSTNPAQDVRHAMLEELTDRQRTVLEAAYFSGFFEWPRVTTGEEVAAALEITPPTFSQHLRTAQNKIFRALFESDPLSA